MAAAPVIVWFRKVIRVGDHPALMAAVDSGRPVIAVYVLDDETPGRWRLGGARRWWLHHSLMAVEGSLRERGNRLVLVRGRASTVLRDLAHETGAKAVYGSRSTEPWARRLEAGLAGALRADGVELHIYPGTLLFEPDSVQTTAGHPFSVFTPFWRVISQRRPRMPIAAPSAIPYPARLLAGDALQSWGLLPTAPDWAGGLRNTWVPGEAAALQRLEDFVAHRIEDYHDARDRPDLDATSHLSPYLANGEISPNTCWHAAQARGDGPGVMAFLKELVWREFSYHLLFHWPKLPEEPFRDQFANFPWDPDPAALKAWQKGRTGYPIVDAGLRQLWQTGWMHNRVRMVTASFLIKHLLSPWQEGEAWFWDTLVDADLANNAMNWQWVAGSGADAAPYFRIFNPVKQGTTYDTAGDYVRRWVPELARLDAAHIHAPWLAPKRTLDKAGVVLGETYPRPIVDHAAARTRALEAFASLNAAAQ